MTDYDVMVVGAGNAALAAVSAREQGAGRVMALEKAPRALRGGNTHYSGGLLRIAFDRAEDLCALVPDAEREVPGFFADVEPYPPRLFMAELLRHRRARGSRAGRAAHRPVLRHGVLDQRRRSDMSSGRSLDLLCTNSLTSPHPLALFADSARLAPTDAQLRGIEV